MPLHYVLSTCGTSLLTNERSNEERSLVNRYANAKTRAEVEAKSAEDAACLEKIITDVQTRMRNASPDDAKRLSAELNGLLTFCGGQKIPGSDQHVLLCTDTWLGYEAASIVADWLRQHGGTVQEVKRQKDLQTSDLESFQVALAELVRWCEETLPGYRQSRYRVVFNLTGGFKSVQGFMQTLALFYADETVYIFESGSALLRIPRLPVRMAAAEAIKRNLRAFRRLANGLPVLESDVRSIPETLLMSIANKHTLSPWGELVWQQSKHDLYAEMLYDPPSDRIVFGPKFKKSTGGLPSDRLSILNERIDDLAVYLEQGKNPPRLDFKPLRGNPRPPSTHECDAWADQDAKRIFGHYDNSVFVLDELAQGLH